jgi:holo-[acyl-carrier protein] synthase
MPRVHVGIDLIEIDRITAALARHPERFRERVYTPREVAECERKPRPAQSYAGRFAGKEAVGKALGRGVPFTWTEIEIAGRGKPLVSLTGSMLAAAERLGVVRVDLSMTHSRTTAAAVAIAVTA